MYLTFYCIYTHTSHINGYENLNLQLARHFIADITQYGMSSGDAKGETEGESRDCSLTVVLSTVNQCIPALFSNTTMPVLLTLNTL